MITAIEHDASAVKMRGEPLGQIIWQGREWAVTDYGLEEKRLHEEALVFGWVRHMAQKNWVDIEDFATAWLVAIALTGLRLTEPMVVQMFKGFRTALKYRDQERRRLPPDPDYPITATLVKSK